MSKLEEMLKKSEVWFEIEPYFYTKRKFLRWSKKNGLKWKKGREIKDTDDCYFHIAINHDKTIANISAICWVNSKNSNAYRLSFKDFLKNQ